VSSRSLAALASAFSCFALVSAAGAFVLQQRAVDAEREARRAEVAALERRLDAVAGRNDRIAGRLSSAEKSLKQKEQGIAPLAGRVLRSVFTVETDVAFGTGFVAWVDDRAAYVLTAAHVVRDQFHGGVTLTRRGGGWQGEIVELDTKNDLALIRMNAKPAGIEPLWQSPRTTPPRPGDELLLIGSPFGLEGSVTRGVVSHGRRDPDRCSRKSRQLRRARNRHQRAGRRRLDRRRRRERQLRGADSPGLHEPPRLLTRQAVRSVG
jgi:S1-C subfamily serine protease